MHNSIKIFVLCLLNFNKKQYYRISKPFSWRTGLHSDFEDIMCDIYGEYIGDMLHAELDLSEYYFIALLTPADALHITLKYDCKVIRQSLWQAFLRI